MFEPESSTCALVRLCLHSRADFCDDTNAYACMYLHMCVYMFTNINVHIHTTHTYLFIHIIYADIYIYIRTYMHTCVFRRVSARKGMYISLASVKLFVIESSASNVVQIQVCTRIASNISLSRYGHKNIKNEQSYTHKHSKDCMCVPFTPAMVCMHAYTRPEIDFPRFRAGRSWIW